MFVSMLSRTSISSKSVSTLEENDPPNDVSSFHHLFMVDAGSVTRKMLPMTTTPLSFREAPTGLNTTNAKSSPRLLPVVGRTTQRLLETTTPPIDGPLA